MDYGYVYIIKAENYYKIGITQNPPKRFISYTEMPYDMEVIICEQVYSYRSVEKNLHSYFIEKRKKGEWFVLNNEDLNYAKKYIISSKENKPNENIQISNKKEVLQIEDCCDSPTIEDKALEKLKDQPYLFLVLNWLKCHLLKDYNIIVRPNGKKYRINDLAEEMGVSRQMASIYIKKLKEINLVAEIETNKGKVYAINPNVYFNGNEIPQRVYDIFENAKRN